MTGNPRMLVIFTGATVLVLGAVVSLATDNWWWLILAVAAHAAGSALVLLVLYRAIDQQDKPDPVEEAALEEADDAPAPTGEGGGRKMAI